MNEAKRKRIVYAVFSIAVLWGLYMQPWTRLQRDTPGPASPESVAAAAVAATSSGPVAELAGGALGSDWATDPFRPSGPREPGEPEERQHGLSKGPVLQGTMTVHGVEICVLDGRVCRTGDQLGSWRIMQIDKGEVTLSGPNQERVTLTTR